MIIFWLIIAAMTLVFLSIVCAPLRRSNTLLLALLLTLPVSAFLLYAQLGASNKLAEAKTYKQRLADVETQIKQLGSRSNVIAKLKEKIKQRPSDSKGWFLLGKLYFSGGDYTLALESFEKANQFNHGDVDIMLGVAMAQFYKDEHVLTSDSKKLLIAVLAKQKDNVNAINLLAVDAFNQQHYQQAVKYWEQILPQFPAASEDAKSILKMIAKAQARV